MRRVPNPIISAALVVFAFAAGWWLGRHHTDGNPSAALTDNSSVRPNKQLGEKGTEPHDRPPASPATPTAHTPSISPALLKFLNDRFNGLGFHPLSDDETKLTDVTVALLDISPDERRRVESALLNARDAMHGLCRAHLKVVSQDKEKAVLTLPPLPEGKAFKKTLSDNLKQTLGEARANVILSRMDDGSFMRFGSGEQTIEIKWYAETVTIEHSYMEDDGKGGKHQGSRMWGRVELPSLYEDLITRR